MEPTPAERAVALELFGDRLPEAERFAEHLGTTGLERGLLGPREGERLWSRHILNCGLAAELIGAERVVDVGSGSGLPGIPLALARPEASFLLVEPLERRVQWLDEVIADLGLTNVEVHRGRSETLFGSERAQVVTSRAVSALVGLVPMTLPLVAPHGRLLAIKGRSAADELRAAGQTIRSFGGVDPEIQVLGEGRVDEPTTVVVVGVGQNGGKIPGKKSSSRHWHG